MATEVRLPQWGMGMQEGTVTQWFKRQGDTVASGEVIAEIEAAKTTEELSAPAEGVLARVVVEEGQTVPVHELLAVIAAPDEAMDVHEAAAGTETEAARVAPGTAGAASAEPAPGGEPHRRQIAPRARALANREGVDLDAVEGTGAGGRVTEDDVRRAATEPTLAGGQTVPLTGMRGTIAERMHQSLRDSAQLTLVTTADVTDLLAWRNSLPDQQRPTVTDLLVKVVALALRDHPAANAHIDAETVRIMPDIHIGIATAVEGGLIVPVVRDADTLSLEALAEERARLVDRVRSGEATAGDLTGGTFTVTNLGGYGVDAFTPIINPPEVAILGAGRTVEVPHRDGDGIAWHQSMTLSLTIDHRAVDGAPGAAFLQRVVGLLGNSSKLTGEDDA